MLVKDYKGELIPQDRARRIKGEDGTFSYYEIGISCIKMDDGKWYRTTTGKIYYDYSTDKWVHAASFTGHFGMVEDGSNGYYSDISKEVFIFSKKPGTVKRTQFDPVNKIVEDVGGNGKKWIKSSCQSEEIAIKRGFQESLFDGCYYKTSDCDDDDRVKINTPNIPANERNNTYSLDDDKQYRTVLENAYDSNDFKVSTNLEKIARKYIPFSFGVEIEIANGTVWKRIREPLGFRTCRDGSIEGQEYVSIPMEGGKGLQAIKNMCEALTKRTILSNKCSVHIHFGDVRRDKLYVVSLWNLLSKIQDELRTFYPYSRTNSIRDDGKIYAALLPDLNLHTTKLLSINDEKKFKDSILLEFNKIYTYLNAGHPPGEVYDEVFAKDSREFMIKGRIQKQYCYRVKKSNYTTTLPRHAIQGQKWQKPSRYHWINLLNLFFAHSRTIEMRIHEASTNFDKILFYMLTSVAILKYAENFNKTLSEENITMNTIIREEFDKELADQIMNYLNIRQNLFCNLTGGFKSSWKGVEQGWMDNDKTYSNKIK